MQQLRVLRLARGLSLDDLAARIGGLVSKQMLSKYETGKSRPAPTVARALAGALGTTVTRLLEPPAYDLEFIAYRKLSGLSQSGQAVLQARLGEELLARLDVQQRLGLPCEAPFVQRMVQDMAGVEALAEEIRSNWGLGTEPVGNLTDVLERKGVHVISALEVPEKFHGLSAVARQGGTFCGAMIAYREVPAGERQRSTMAHELGHLLLSTDGGFDEEKAAQSFASAFLMPRTVMYETLGVKRQNVYLQELLALKTFFGASMQAIIFRAKTLEIINESVFKDLMITFSTRGWRKAEPGALPVEAPQHWRQLVQRAVAEGVLTSQEANRLIPGIVPAEPGGLDRRELLRLSPEKRRALLEQQARSVSDLYEPGSPHVEWLGEEMDEEILDT